MKRESTELSLKMKYQAVKIFYINDIDATIYIKDRVGGNYQYTKEQLDIMDGLSVMFERKSCQGDRHCVNKGDLL